MNRAQAQFVREQFLNRFRGEFLRVNRDTLPVLEKILYDSGLEFNDTIRRNLEKSGSIASGGLADVSAPQVYQEGTNYVLGVGYPLGSKQMKYYDFINKGVKGVGGVKAKPNKNSGKYSFKSPNPSYFMANAIARWLRDAKRKVSADRLDLSKVQKKRRKLSKMVDEATSRRKLSFAIASKVKRDGIRATYYFDRAVNKVFNQGFREAIETAIGADILIQIRQ